MTLLSRQPNLAKHFVQLEGTLDTMLAADANQASKKRKPSTSIANPAAAKKPRPPPSNGLPPRAAHDSPLCAPHTPILQDLGAKYDVLPASVISSTPIGKRLEYITTHLLGGGAGGGGGDGRKKPRVVLLYARAAEVCKMITVAEKCKRLLEEQGEAAWYQYNQLFDVSREDAERATRKREERKKKKRVVEETVLNVEEGEKKEGEEEEEEEEEDGDASDAFETMQSRFEKAVVPPAPDRTTKSLRIFLSTVAIPELKAKDGVTVQTSGK